MRRWGHPHSVAMGIILAYSLTYRPWLIFGAGILVGFLAAVVRRAASTALRRWRPRVWARGNGGARAPIGASPADDWDTQLLAAYERGKEQGALEVARREGRRAAKAQGATRDDLSPRVIY